MDLFCLELNHLESLSDGELLELADVYGLDIPRQRGTSVLSDRCAGLHNQRLYIIEELLDCARLNTSAEYEARDGNDTARDNDTVKEESEIGDETCAELPKHYNISFIEVNVRDPLWVFVFWEIKTHERGLHENAPDFEGYCLRAVQLAENDMAAGGTVAFTVAVDADDISWYLGFPPGDGRLFQVELCALHGTGGVVLAVSRPFRLPRLINNRNGNGDVGNPMAQLSGAGNYSLTRSVDRLPRSREP